MDLTVPAAATNELAAAWFQGAVTLGIFLLFVLLERRYRKPWFRGWAVAWGVYTLRLSAIIVFLHTEGFVWLYWHQVLTGITALALLWATLVFTRGTAWRWRYLAVGLFPLVWSHIAIYELDNFLAAALPAVVFLSGATALTALAIHGYARAAGSIAARWLAIALAVWALHHLDYPFLRARGVWNPWGYFLDLGFQLWVATGILLLVQEDLREGIRALATLSSELQSARTPAEVREALIEKARSLRGVIGCAIWTPAEGFVATGGEAEVWREAEPSATTTALLRELMATGEPRVASPTDEAIAPFLAAIPILRHDEVWGALLLTGRVRDPFNALDDAFLRALGQQMGAALHNADLAQQSEERGRELEALQVQLVRRHEEERDRLSRELHDETAQVLAAVSLRLGMVGESAPPEQRAALDEARALVSEGIRGIRRVTSNLRPTALDHLGVVAAVRALVRDYDARHGLHTTFTQAGELPELDDEVELVIYRATQEALANAARHAPDATVSVNLAIGEERLELVVQDDGPGLPEGVTATDARRGTGIAGIRERVRGVGGTLDLISLPGEGVRLEITVPCRLTPGAPDA
ncbi:MAG: histidine kinase [Longimicrobiales bacterium]|nr:histidine kinase [Longimicrobiales bacterium]